MSRISHKRKGFTSGQSVTLDAIDQLLGKKKVRRYTPEEEWRTETLVRGLTLDSLIRLKPLSRAKDDPLGQPVSFRISEGQYRIASRIYDKTHVYHIMSDLLRDAMQLGLIILSLRSDEPTLEMVLADAESHVKYRDEIRKQISRAAGFLEGVAPQERLSYYMKVVESLERSPLAKDELQIEIGKHSILNELEIQRKRMDRDE